jgi:hypothetical protein
MGYPRHRGEREEKAMTRIAAGLFAILIAAQPVAADEFEDVLESALDAYRAGDLTVAKEELDYALQLLASMRAEALADFLPPAQEGWERLDSDAQSEALAFGMFGGGTAASATYRRGEDEFTLTILADSPMVSGMAAMISGMAGMSGSRPLRIQRQQFSIGEEEVQGVIGGRILVQAQGRAPTDAMIAHIEAMDLAALAGR